MIGCYVNDAELLVEYSVNPQKMSPDGLFYYRLFEKLYQMGYQTLDEVSIFAFIQENEQIKVEYEKRGGYNTLRELSNIIDISNIQGYVDTFNKYCLLEELYSKGFNIEKDFSKFEQMTASQVFDYFEYQLNSISVDIGDDVEFDTFDITDGFIEDLESGENVGIQYGKYSPLMNYLTLGLPKGDLTLIGSYINQGKSSFVSNNLAFAIAESGIKVGILANEMQSKAYKLLLLLYVMVNRLDYYKLTRKKLKIGKFTDEDKIMINRARDIIKEEYVPYLFFAKTFDYEITKTRKIIKKWSKLGAEVIIYDTLKADLDNAETWKDLIASSRELYQLASKENIAIIGVMQLALYTNQRRLLDLDVLANGKQASEPASECIFFRSLHPNEKKGERFELKCYKMVKDASGKYSNVKEYIDLDPDKTYRIFFIAKTRNDQVGTAIVYEFKGHYNIWKEVGFADVRPDSF